MSVRPVITVNVVGNGVWKSLRTPDSKGSQDDEPTSQSNLQAFAGSSWPSAGRMVYIRVGVSYRTRGGNALCMRHKTRVESENTV
jgi:hypothetical protein